jgi:CRISPR-associated endonuclease/helicase Cas3
MPSFDEWFKHAAGNDPFPYQRRFAEEGEIPELVDVPTGLGKTAMAAWVHWKRCHEFWLKRLHLDRGYRYG